MIYFLCGFAYYIELILVVDLGLYIKLGLNYEILSLGLMKFILIYHVLSLINRTYVLVINLKFLN